MKHGTGETKRALKQARRIYEKTGDETKALEKANEILGGFGIEGLPPVDGDFRKGRGMSYVNMGDTYDETIAFDEETSTFSISCWGDWLEQAEEAYTEETGKIRCPYCGEWHGESPEDWTGRCVEFEPDTVTEAKRVLALEERIEELEAEADVALREAEELPPYLRDSSMPEGWARKPSP